MEAPIKRALVVLIRGTAVVAGLLFIASDVMDIAGFIPYSEEMPPVGKRIAHSLPTLGASIVLLLPYRYFLEGLRFQALRTALILLMIAVFGPAVFGIHGYAIGKKSWHIVPVVAIFFLVPAANFWALVQMRRQRR